MAYKIVKARDKRSAAKEIVRADNYFSSAWCNTRSRCCASRLVVIGAIGAKLFIGRALFCEGTMLRYADQRAPEIIERHYTPAALAARLVELVPLSRRDIVLDPAAGHNNVFLNAFPTRRTLRCELEDGTDFLVVSLAYDWAVTNPPYHLLWAFIDKASQEARRGFAFLVNLNGINTLTPRRLQLLRQRGFHMRHLHVCNVQGWHGRYFFYVFAKTRGRCVHTWDLETWKN